MASAKLASLFIRTLSKPLATYFKTQAKERPGFRNICISVAQTYHVIEMKLSMRFLDYKKETIRPLNETKAVELGANFLSEVFVFSVAVGCILAGEFL